MSDQAITILGMGNMGSTVAQSLARASLSNPPTIWNRTVDSPFVHAATAAGAHLEPDLASTVSRSPLILSLLLDNNTVREVLSTLPAGALAGKTIINMPNGTPKQAEEMQAYVLKDLGAGHYLDGAVMCTPDMIGTPASIFFFSGDDTALVSAEARLAAAGRSMNLGAQVGAASRHDNALLAVMYSMLNGGYLAIAMLKKGGLEATHPFVDGTVVPVMRELVPLLAEEAKAFDEQRFNDAGGNSLGMQHVGLENILQMAADDGLDGGPLEYARNLMARAIRVTGREGVSSVLPQYLLHPEK